MSAPVNHETLVFERRYDAPVGRVFDAFADPQARMRWGAPSPNTGLVYDSVDFRVGGFDVGRCGPRINMIYAIEVRYLDIIPGERIIWTEAVSEAGNALSFSLITTQFRPEGNHTLLSITDQIVAFGGPRMIAGSREGFSAALDNLHAELRRAG